MWKTRQEIIDTYNDHLDSLQLSGIPFDAQSIYDEMENELRAWDAEHQ